MKTTKIIIKNLLFILVALTSVTNTANAQNSKEDKQTTKRIAAKNMIDSQNFIFVPRTVSPLRGGIRELTSYYDLEVSKDTIISYLPYFGRAYTAPLNPSEAGINFTSTNFDYKVIPGKKGSWNVSIKPKNDVNVQELLLRIFDNSSASLNVTSHNRDPISYQGYITERKQKK